MYVLLILLIIFVLLLFLAKTMSHKHKPYFSGEMLISGKGEIILGKQLPSRHSINVAFKPQPVPPCQGHNKPDHLHWLVVIKKHGYYLKLEWNVSSTRTILWTVSEK